MTEQIYRMHFSDKGTYSYQTLKDGKNYSGTYTYKVLRKDVSVIKAREKHEDIPVEYRMIMMHNLCALSFYGLKRAAIPVYA